MNEEKKYIGVYKVSGSRWKSQIQINNQQKYLGLFNSPFLAAKAYDEKARPLGRNLNFDNDLSDDISPLSTNESIESNNILSDNNIEMDALKLRKLFIGLTLKALKIADENVNENVNDDCNNHNCNVYCRHNKQELNQMLEELSRPLLQVHSPDSVSTISNSSSDSISIGCMSISKEIERERENEE